MVQAALDHLLSAAGRTSVVIAHRLSTVRSADAIAVVQEGRVVEQGSHQTLYADTSSVYHELVRLQQAGGGIL